MPRSPSSRPYVTHRCFALGRQAYSPPKNLQELLNHNAEAATTAHWPSCGPASTQLSEELSPRCVPVEAAVTVPRLSPGARNKTS
jgi:hypothetical protein